MKTIFVVYGNDTRAYNDCKTKRYAFNTESDVKVGDKLNSREYSSDMVVKEVLNTSFKYYNNLTGDLSNELTSTAFRDIKTMEIVDRDENVIYAIKVEDSDDE